MAKKSTAVVVKRKKFQSVEIPIIRTKIELIGDSVEELKDKTMTLDLTRQLKGKSVEAVVKVKIEDKKAVAYPIKIKVMPYFIRRMIRKRISYVEDSFDTPSQESLMKVKPFLITRKKVSRAVRKALRNRCRNWIEDYIAEKKDDEIFNDVLSNKLQKILSLSLKKTYPLSLCEIRILENLRPLTPEEVPKIKKKTEIEKQEPKQLEEEIIDQMAELENEKKEKAEKEIKKTQEKAVKLEDSETKKLEKPEKKEKIKKEKKPTKKKKEEEK